MCNIPKKSKLLYNFWISFNYTKLQFLLIVTHIYNKIGNLISNYSTDLFGF